MQLPLRRRVMHICPQKHGRVVYSSVLRNWTQDGSLLQLDAALAAAVPGQRPCPSCANPMHVAQVFRQRLDACRACDLVWLDPGEFERVPQKPESEVHEHSDAIIQKEIVQGIQWREGCSPFQNIRGEKAGFPLVTVLFVLAFTVVSYMARHAHDPSWFVFFPEHPFRHFGIPAITSLFTHGGVNHFLGNSIFFLSVGAIIEKTLGEENLIELFFFSGLAGVLAHACFSSNPVLGASGAISGVMMALVLTQPQATFVMDRGYMNHFGFFTVITRIPIWIWAMLWCFLQVSELLMDKAKFGHSGIAYMAHIGGAVAGVIYVSVTDLKVMVPRIARK